MGVGTALSGLDRVAQPRPTARQQAPSELLVPLLILSLSVGVVVSYLILRSSWHGGAGWCDVLRHVRNLDGG